MCPVHGLEECYGQGVYESNSLDRIRELAGIKKEENMNGMGHFAAMGEADYSIDELKDMLTGARTQAQVDAAKTATPPPEIKPVGTAEPPKETGYFVPRGTDKPGYQNYRPTSGPLTTQIPRQPEQSAPATTVVKPMGSDAPDTSLLKPSRPFSAADIKPFGYK